MKRTKTFTIEYTYFEPGTKVVLSNGPILGLKEGEVYTVEECSEPFYASDEPLVFIKGVKFGLCPDRFREVK